MLIARGRHFRLEKRHLFPLIALGLLLALSSLALFESYHYMAAGIASTLLFVYPIMVALIMTLCFREKLTKLTLFCIVIALSGIGLLYQGDDGDTLNLVGVLLVMASSLFYANYIVAVNRPFLQGIATLKLTFYTLLFGVSLFIFRVDFGPTAISFLCTTQAIQCIGATPTAILGALEPLTAVFFGIMIFGEAMTPRLAIGILLIISAVTLIIAGNTVTTHLLRLRKLFPRLPFRRFWSV